jgi:AraC family transcriptional regulator, glycine betaine-responsive activator
MASVLKTAPLHIGFMLLRHYSMIAFANAVEVLRMANYLSGKPLYRWVVVAADSDGVDASNGLRLHCAASADALDGCDTVFVCGGVDVQAATTEALRQDLRCRAARGQTLGALCTGAYALASAGVLDGYRCAIHWENLAAIREDFPQVGFAREIFLIDRNRCTASGGTAPLHLMLHLVRQQQGARLALDISEQFVVDRMRAQGDEQRVPQPECIGPGYQHMAEAIELMAANIEEPLPMAEIAGAIHLSLRQLERLFRRYHAMSPAQYYMNQRLRRSRELLTHTAMPIMQITVACGFQSSSHFCKAYRALFGSAPSELRRREVSKTRMVPELPLQPDLQTASARSFAAARNA